MATRKLKSTPVLKDIPVVYFSANSEIQSLMKQAGADTFLAKPFELSELETVIDSVLKR